MATGGFGQEQGAQAEMDLGAALLISQKPLEEQG